MERNSRSSHDDFGDDEAEPCWKKWRPIADVNSHLQAFYRGRIEAYQTRVALRSRFDSLLSSSTSPSEQSVIEATRLLGLFFVDRNASDVKRAAAWCRALLGKAVGSAGELDHGCVPKWMELTQLMSGVDKAPLLFSLYRTGGESWPTLLKICVRIILLQATGKPS